MLIADSLQVAGWKSKGGLYSPGEPVVNRVNRANGWSARFDARA